MLEISLHILDLVMNSIEAKSSRIEIEILEDTVNNIFYFSINDDGCGMSKAFLREIENPFVTTRTTRRVGLGVPLIKQACIDAGGDFYIKSCENVGTYLKATFKYDHIDRQPLGDIKSTILTLITSNPSIDFKFTHRSDGKSLELDTGVIKKQLGSIPVDNFKYFEIIDNKLKFTEG